MKLNTATPRLASCWLPAPSAFCATEIWNTKDPSVWTTEDANIILNKSPWAKQIKVGSNQRPMQRGGRRGGMGYPGRRIPWRGIPRWRWCSYPGGGGGYPQGGGGGSRYPGNERRGALGERQAGPGSRGAPGRTVPRRRRLQPIRGQAKRRPMLPPVGPKISEESICEPLRHHCGRVTSTEEAKAGTRTRTTIAPAQALQQLKLGRVVAFRTR